MLERLTVAEAAMALGVTQEAIRQRIRRGTIEHEKGEDGKTYVYLTDKETRTQQTANGVTNSVVQGYIEALKSQIQSLQQDRNEWRDEARRSQHIIMALTQRIPELEQASPETPSEDPQSNGPPEEGVSLRPETQEPQNGSAQRSWWQRIFGG